MLEYTLNVNLSFLWLCLKHPFLTEEQIRYKEVNWLLFLREDSWIQNWK